MAENSQQENEEQMIKFPDKKDVPDREKEEKRTAVMKIRVQDPKAMMLIYETGSGVVEQGAYAGEKIIIGHTVTEGSPIVLYRNRYAGLDITMSMFVEFCCRAIDKALELEVAKAGEGGDDVPTGL